MKAWFRYAQPLALATAIAVVVGACNESLEGGEACPLLCPQQQNQVRDTTFFAAELDSSVAGFPSIGREVAMFLAAFGDTLQTRGVVRYDTLRNRFFHSYAPTSDSAVIAVDTGAIVRFTVNRGDTLAAGGTVELYDVDLAGAEDADPTAVASAFTPDRFLGSRDYTARDTLVDVPVDPNKLLAKITAPSPGNRLRVGVRVTGSGSAKLLVRTREASTGSALLMYRPAIGDTSVAIERVLALSKTPSDPFIAADLADYFFVTTAPPAAPADVIRVGGLPARRVYLKFNIPSRIIDSSSVVRATLQLTQRPNSYAPTPRDSLSIAPYAVTVGPLVTDISKSLLFLFAPEGTDSLRVASADAGVRDIEIIRIVKLWSVTAADKTPRAIGLRAQAEGSTPAQLDFYSMEAAPALRPRLRITYLPRQQGGLP